MSPAARARLLPVVVLALALFALIKLGGAWFEFSSATAGQAPVFAAQNIVAANGQNEHAAEAPAPELAPSEVERRILERLAERRATLDARADALDAREAVIAAAEKRLSDRVVEFERERTALFALRNERETVASEEIEALVSAYERMKAKDAAAIFNELDEDILVPVSAGMRTQALAGVLSEMQPDKARQLTRLLANRNEVDAGGQSPVAQ